MIDLAEEEKRRRALLIHEDMLRGVTRQEHAALHRRAIPDG